MTIRTKRLIAETLGWLCWLLMLGVVGGTELGFLPMTAMWWAAGLLAVGSALLWKGGMIRVR